MQTTALVDVAIPASLGDDLIGMRPVLVESRLAPIVLRRGAMVARVEELAAYQRCLELCEVIFNITRDLSDADFRRDIRRAARASPPLIAEGFARFTDGEIVRYLRMARGELGEVQSHLRIGRDQNYFPKEIYDSAATLARRAMGTTTNLLKSKLRELNRRPKR